MLRVEWRRGLVNTVSGGGGLGMERERRDRGVRVSWYITQELAHAKF